jgi:hypothetical protein
MSDATALRLAQILKYNGTSVMEDLASLQRLLAPGAAEIPADVAALLLMLDTKAVAHLFKWAKTTEPHRAEVRTGRQNQGHDRGVGDRCVDERGARVAAHNDAGGA